jgi:hypothetical protein
VAQVSRATYPDIDRLLDRAVAAWEELTEVEREIDGWRLEDQLVFVEEWPLEEARLQRLADLDQAGVLSRAQRGRYVGLLRLVERQRPIIERLQRA